MNNDEKENDEKETEEDKRISKKWTEILERFYNDPEAEEKLREERKLGPVDMIKFMRHYLK